MPAKAKVSPVRKGRVDAERNRQLLLEAAEAVFAEKAASASLEEIARAAGVGIGTLYRHFPTRDALIEAAARRSVDILISGIRKQKPIFGAPVRSLSPETGVNRRGTFRRNAMSHAPGIGGLFHDRLRSSSNRLFWLGAAMVVLGVAAIIFPMISTLVATLLVGWVLLLSGGFMFVGSFSIHGTGPFFGALLLSLLSLAAGVFLLFNPLAGAVGLTLMVGAIFVIQGAFEISFAFETRPHAGWPVMLGSGLISLAMGILIAAGWPAISVILLGILLGVNFISTGFGYIFLSRTLKLGA